MQGVDPNIPQFNKQKTMQYSREMAMQREHSLEEDIGDGYLNPTNSEVRLRPSINRSVGLLDCEMVQTTP